VHHDRFTVAFEAGPSVLDALRRIRAEQDAMLAMRISCISASACKECMLLLDGAVVYACAARLERGRSGSTPCRTSPCCAT